MLSIHDRPSQLCDGIDRREWLRVGGLSAIGLSLPQLLRAQPNSRPAGPAPMLGEKLGGAAFGRAKNIIFLWLQGGPPQHETFDPKPDAPEEIRGPFKPIATNVLGIQFCELLPRTARIADKLAIVRSISTNDDNHDVSGYWLLTGYPYGPGSARQIKPNDWPYFGSLVKMLKPSEKLPALTSVWIPDVMRLNDSVTPAGQTAGFLGRQWDPDRFIGDPASPNYRIEGLNLEGETSPVRLDRRFDLLTQLDAQFRKNSGKGEIANWDQISQYAYDLVTSGKARAAFDIAREPEAVRDRYGRHTWGQSVLLARRLIEAGVRLVHVNWSREAGDSAVDNPMWDTHAQNADRLQDCLCPQFDISFTALIEDLEQRGLLNETLVVAIGEFGRTPRINKLGGRDHWGRVFSFALAGAGIRGGQVLGSSDKLGAFPATDPIQGQDFTATLFHLLGIDHQGMFPDKTGRPHLLTKGEPLYRLLGDAPATLERTAPGGDPNFVPPYDARLLLDTDFRSGQGLIPASPPTRDRGWRADGGGLLVERVAGNAPYVAMGIPAQNLQKAIPAGATAILGQEIRNARGGNYVFTVQASGFAGSRETYEAALDQQLACRLVLFRFRDVNKNLRNIDVLATAPFQPIFGETRSFPVEKFLGSLIPGANFAIGNGLGVAIVVEKRTAAEAKSVSVEIRIHSVKLEFSARPRHENVVD